MFGRKRIMAIAAGAVAAASATIMLASSAFAATYPAPTGHSDTPYSTSVSLGWSAVSGASEYHYQVELSSNDALKANNTTTLTHASVTGLKSSTKYRWRVSVTPSGTWTGWTSFSTKAATTPPPSPPPSNACVAKPNGGCGPYTSSSIYNSNVQGTNVSNQSLASDGTSYAGNLTATSASSWAADLTVKNNGGAVEGYPDSNQMLAGSTSPYNPAPVSGFTGLTSSFASTFPHTSGTSAESAYDIWTDPVGTDVYNNGWNQETMIWTDQYDRFNGAACGTDSGATVRATNVPFGGLDWDLCLYGTPPGQSGANTNDNSEWIWYLPGNQVDSGTIDIQAMINYEISHGDLPSNIGYTEINYGFEVCGTSGAENFQVSNFTLAATKG